MTAVLSPLRAGRITGSRVAAVLGASKYQTRAEVLRDMVRDAYGDQSLFTGNAATAYGHEHEPDALAAYESLTGELVHSAQEIVIHPDHDFLAVTPDGLVGDDGMVEFKCPVSARYDHIDDRPDYECQVRLQLACLERKWCDFTVWREGEPLAVSRVDYDPLWLPAMLPKLTRFMAEYRAVVADQDRALVVRLGHADAVPELIRQRDQARRIATELEAENASLLDTIRDKELRD